MLHHIQIENAFNYLLKWCFVVVDTFSRNKSYSKFTLNHKTKKAKDEYWNTYKKTTVICLYIT